MLIFVDLIVKFFKFTISPHESDCCRLHVKVEFFHQSQDQANMSEFTKARNPNAPQTGSAMFCDPRGPVDPAGRQYDLSDRPLLCSSSNMRNEVVIGGSDHALYAIDVSDPRKSPITMYTKTAGHTDWVTSVAHLADGHVLSAAMDGKLCLWSAHNRRTCVDLHRSSTHPISKVVADVRYNTALSLCYDGGIEIWKFPDHQSTDTSSSSSALSRRSNASASRPSSQVISPMRSLSGIHTQPVLECAYHQDTLATGDKAGSLVIWDLERGDALTRFRAHPSPISAIIYEEDSRSIISAGTDGYVKVWDPRASGSGLVMKTHVYQGQPAPAPTPAARGSSSAVARAGRGSTGRSAPSNPALNALPAGQVMSGGNPISVMSAFYNRGSSSDLSYIVTGGGSPADSRLCVIDPRNAYQPVMYLDHHRNGVYSMCVVGDDTVFTGDGMGTLLCHNLYDLMVNGNVNSRSALRYGLGACQNGAVRGINCLGGKIVTTNEDGKALVFDY